MNKRMSGLLTSIGGIGVACVLVACGSGSSDSSTAQIRYSQQPAIASGSTEITGVRGVTGSPDVYLTGINQDNGTNYALLYQGPIQMTSATQWNRIGPTGKCIVTVGNPCEVPSGLNFYGPNNGTAPGNVVVVGNYNLPNDRFPYGLLYRGDVAGNGTYTKINPSSLIDVPSALKYTIAHSNMNGVVVGNYAKSDAVGHAFIMVMGNTPDNPATYTYYPIPESLVNGAVSMTAYGIWYNPDRQNYTIVGGYSKVDSKGISTGYIVDWNPLTQQFSNFLSVFYNNNPADTRLTHFEGITTDDAGGYYLATDWSATGVPEGAALVQIKRNSDGSFATPTWTMLAYPGAVVTSANTVYRKNVLGIYANPVTPYLATVP
jgi:hypothetical protein